MPPTIAAFNFTDTHEVVGFGRVLRPCPSSTEPGLEIVLAKVVDAATEALDPQTVVVRVGCGQLMVVTIGSQWRCGVCVGRRLFGRPIVGEVSHAKDIVLGERPLSAAPSALDGVRGMPCYLLKVRAADLRLAWIVVPVAEVVRALFGVSSEFLVQLFGGLRDPLLAPSSGFFHRSLSAWQTPDCFRLACNRSPTDMEAVLAARVLAVPEFREVHDGVFRRRQQDIDGEGRSPMAMGFPLSPCADSRWTFEGRVLPKVEAKSGEADAVRTFLVCRILRIPFEPPFKRVEVSIHRLAPSETGPGSRGRIGIRPGSPIPRLQEDETSGVGVGVAHEVPGAVLEPAHEIEVVHLPLDAGGAPALLFHVVGDGSAELLGSTGDRRPGGRAAHVSFRRDRRLLADPNDPRDERTRSREATWQATAAAAAAAGWPIVHGASRDDGSPRLEKAGAFDVLLVCVRTRNCDVFVVDAGTVSGDERSVGLLRRRDGMPFDAERDVVFILAHVARRSGRWRRKKKKPEGFEVATIDRRPEGVWKTASDYHAMVSDRLKRFLPGEVSKPL